MFFKRVLFYFFLFIGIGSLNAQNIEYGVELDTNYMLIGDQQYLTFKVRKNEGLKIVFPQLQDTVVNGVEIISGPVRDSVHEKDGKWLVRERYLITAFDSGLYMIPPMPIKIEGDEYNNIVRTDPIGFAVNTYDVDPQKGNHDIYMPYKAPWTFMEIFPYFMWSLLGIAVVLILLYVWLRYKKHKPLFEPPKEIIPPYNQAISSLDIIKERKLWQPGHEKEYYTRLTDVVRLYLSGELRINAMEQSTTETLLALRQCKRVEKNECMKVEEMLAMADYVKFAKYTPLQDENSHYLDSAYDFVNSTHKRWEEEIAEQKRKEEESEKAAAAEENVKQ